MDAERTRLVIESFLRKTEDEPFASVIGDSGKRKLTSALIRLREGEERAAKTLLADVFASGFKCGVLDSEMDVSSFIDFLEKALKPAQQLVAAK